jgi:hypothetical protein
MQPGKQRFNRREFLDFSRKGQRARLLLFLVSYLGGMLLFLVQLRASENNLAWALLWFSAFLGYGILFPLLWIRFFIPAEQRRFLKCPACRKSTAPPNRFVIATTGNCGHCGETILED